MNDIKTGIVNKITITVEPSMLAVNVGSGTLEVLATPTVAALMERAACELIQPYLPEGITTVGTMITINHLSSTPLGAEVTAEAKLTDTADRKYTFELTARDNAGVIATGKHERFTVKSERFTEKTNSKLINKGNNKI